MHTLDNGGATMSDDLHIWRLVYDHEADGTVRFGNLEDLVFAAQGGQDIKIVYFQLDPNINASIVWSRIPSAVTVTRPDEGNTVVSCIITDIPDTKVIAGPLGEEVSVTGRFFEQPFAFEWQAFNTTGKRHIVTFDHRTQNATAVDTDNRRIQWYVRGRTE
jgi:hypothetical protein